MRTDRRTDRQTGMTRLIVAFRNFANAPKNNNISSLYRDKYEKRKNVEELLGCN